MKNKELKINQKVYFLDKTLYPNENRWGDSRIRNGKVVEVSINRGRLQYKVDNRDYIPYTQENIGSSLFLNKKDAIKGLINLLKNDINTIKEIIQKKQEAINKIKTDPSFFFE